MKQPSAPLPQGDKDDEDAEWVGAGSDLKQPSAPPLPQGDDDDEDAEGPAVGIRGNMKQHLQQPQREQQKAHSLQAPVSALSADSTPVKVLALPCNQQEECNLVFGWRTHTKPTAILSSNQPPLLFRTNH